MTGSIVAMVVGVVTAAIVGVVGIAITVPDAVATYWWILPIAVALVAALTPPVLRRLVALAFRVTKRTEEPAHVSGGALLGSAAWSVLMWLLLGLQAWLLLREIAPGPKSDVRPRGRRVRARVARGLPRGDRARGRRRARGGAGGAAWFGRDGPAGACR